MPLDPFLETLSDETVPIPVAEFAEMSDLSPSELGEFARAWFGIDEDRQHNIITAMVEAAEENAELDFSAVFKMCLRDKDEFVLEKAIEGLWENEDRSIIPGLVQVLQSDHSPGVRAAAAVALGKFAVLAQEGKLLSRDVDALHNSLMDVLRDTDQPLEVRRRSLEAIAPMNTGEINSLVSDAYESDDPGHEVQFDLRNGPDWGTSVGSRYYCASWTARNPPSVTNRPTPVESWPRRTQYLT